MPRTDFTRQTGYNCVVMEILYEQSNFPKNVSLILGFFDGVHAGHQDVIKNTANSNKVIVTFKNSPAEFFGKDFSYIYTRKNNYEILEQLGVNYIFEREFSDLAKISAKDYLEDLINKFSPESITTGFNHTFGANKQGTSKFLEENQNNYKYFCTPATEINNIIISSTQIKTFLSEGKIELANQFLTRNFSLESVVIEGNKLGRTLGFPTANLKYPEQITKIPYGVYKVKALDRIAIMNWGIKPTIGAEEVLEVHIPNFKENLYGKNLKIEVLSKIRNEKKFNNLEELKQQINKDIEECLKS